MGWGNGGLWRDDDPVPEREDLQLPIGCRRYGGKPIAPPDGSNGSDVEALLDQGGG
jgi:hypothetical protein